MNTTESVDLLIIGAGAAGLAAAIFAAESAPKPLRILLIDGARKPGAKIIVSGGGRCNVTHRVVTPDDYWGGPKPTIRNVLRAFDENRTVAWMETLGVALKLEETGKYFPVTDSARTVLDALMNRVRALGVEMRADCRLLKLRPDADGFTAELRDRPDVRARAAIVATGGLSLPKSGSDGAGLGMLLQLGHHIVPTTPALSPLVLTAGEGTLGDHAELSGLTWNARLALRDSAGRLLAEQTGSLLFTHFGLSGPAALNISRHLLRRRVEGRAEGDVLTIGHPDLPTEEAAERWLLGETGSGPRRKTATALDLLFPSRIAERLAGEAGTLAQLPRDQRRSLARAIAGSAVRVTGDRGYSFAETTAGGVDLREIRPATMESRPVPRLFLCGELLDVDGRIGGFNFQWAWASGYLAGRAAAAAAGIP